MSISDRASASEGVDYLQSIKPVLHERCTACHGALKQEAGLRLDTAALAKQGGDSGPAIMPGDAESSLLMQRVAASDESERMPPEGKPLTPQQIAAIASWISQKAPAPAVELPEQSPRDHWAFRPLVRPATPSVPNAGWVRNPIDAFIAQKHEEHELTPPVAAPPQLLLRRVYFDLVGLPPTDEDVKRALASPEEDWFEPLVDRLLADERHGERWARHWMDIWRYSDSWGLGEQLRNSQPHIWHWRDWIVESLNANIPYDEMVRLMLAADELHPTDANKLRATGYLARNWALFGRNLWMEEAVEHVAKGFLGLTMNCAKCHDHKYDPIEQVDFYRMRAFFEPYHARLDMANGETDFAKDGIPRVFDGALTTPTYLFVRGQESQPDTSTAIAPGVPEILKFSELAIQPVSLPAEAWQPERRDGVVDAYLEDAKEKVATADAAIEAAKKAEPDADAAVLSSKVRVAELAAAAARAELRAVERRTAATRAAWATTDDAKGRTEFIETAKILSLEAVKAERQAALAQARWKIAETENRLAVAGADAKAGIETELAAARDAFMKAEQTASAVVEEGDVFTPLVGAKWTPTRFLSSTADDPTVAFPAHSTGRRSALAAWITDRRNPLTARVAVNHIWARHMGAPLVATVFDFGRKGSPPAHPELLNWLAAELIDSGWDMKRLHRLIVTSSAYRMASSTAGSDANLAKDPDNLRLWHRRPVRLESEAVRDAILQLAGTLDLSRGGPPVAPAAQADSKRRSLYFFHSNNERNSFLTTFDAPLVKECYRRDESVVPQQALALSNSSLVHDASRLVAQRLSERLGKNGAAAGDSAFIEAAFLEVLGVRASVEEVAASAAAMDEWRKLPNESADGGVDPARQHLVWALLNHNDFITVR